MIVGLSSRMLQNPADWHGEFERACHALGLEPRTIRIDRDGWMEEVRQAGVFIWRPMLSEPSETAEIRTKIPLIEAMGIPCYPNSLMLWLFDDKIRETFFMRERGYPMPETFISFSEAECREYLERAAFPLVTKTHMGASSSGVMLLRTKEEALRLAGKIFRKDTILDKALEKYHYLPRLEKGDFLLARKHRYLDACPRYLYLQAFIETDADWRITTLGSDLVSVYVRRNRPNDFRASGGGRWEMVAPEDIPADAFDLALEISNRHGFTSMAYDFMKSPKGWVFGEISMSFILNKVYSDTLYRRTPQGYVKEASIPIGVMHLQALLAAKEAGTAIPSWPMS